MCLMLHCFCNSSKSSKYKYSPPVNNHVNLMTSWYFVSLVLKYLTNTTLFSNGASECKSCIYLVNYVMPVYSSNIAISMVKIQQQKKKKSQLIKLPTKYSTSRMCLLNPSLCTFNQQQSEVQSYWTIGWSVQGGRLESFSSVTVFMGQPQALKNPARFIPTVLEKVSAYRFIFPSLSLGKLLILW